MEGDIVALAGTAPVSTLMTRFPRSACCERQDISPIVAGTMIINCLNIRSITLLGSLYRAEHLPAGNRYNKRCIKKSCIFTPRDTVLQHASKYFRKAIGPGNPGP